LAGGLPGGRKASCIYHGAQSKFRTVHIGFPQGSVISPALFNFFVADFPEAPEELVSFADDFLVAASDPSLTVIEISLNKYMTRISKWAMRKRLKISSTKSQATMFTPNSREHHDKPQIVYNSEVIPVDYTIKILGLTDNTQHTFSPQLISAKSKACSHILLFRAGAGSD
jgi:hypothetical protein